MPVEPRAVGPTALRAIMPRMPATVVLLVLYPFAGAVLGLWLHDIAAARLSGQVLTVAQRVADSSSAGVLSQDERLLTFCGYVPPVTELAWLRRELKETTLGIGVRLPDAYRKGVVLADPLLVSAPATSRWVDVFALAAAAALTAAAAYSVGAALALRRGASTRVQLVCAGRARAWLGVGCFIAPLLVFYVGVNRLEMGSYGAGAFTPPAVPFLVVVAAWAGALGAGAMLASTARSAWASRGAPARCPRCAYLWNGRRCSECAARWAPGLWRYVVRRRLMRVAVAALTAGAIGTAIWFAVLPGDAQSKAKYAVRWLMLRPTTYSVDAGDYLRTDGW